MKVCICSLDNANQKLGPGHNRMVYRPTRCSIGTMTACNIIVEINSLLHAYAHISELIPVGLLLQLYNFQNNSRFRAVRIQF
jgi:hypothetical protein